MKKNDEKGKIEFNGKVQSVIIGGNVSLNIDGSAYSISEIPDSDILKISENIIKVKEDEISSLKERISEQKALIKLQGQSINEYSESIKDLKHELENKLNQIGKYKRFQGRIDEFIANEVSRDLSKVGTIYKEALSLFINGKIDEALSTLEEKRLKEELRKIEEQEKETINARSELAETYQLKMKMLQLDLNKGDLGKSINAGEEGVDVADNGVKPNKKKVAEILNDLIISYRRLSKYDKAIKIGNEVLNIKKQLSEIHPLSFAMTYGNLGLAYEDNGNYSEALKCQNLALEIREEYLNESHKDAFVLAKTFNNYAKSLERLKRHEEAETYYLKSLNLRQKLFNNKFDHRLAIPLNNIAILYERIADIKEDNKIEWYKKSIQYAQEALIIRLVDFPENNAYIGTSFSNIGITLRRLKEYEKSLGYANKGKEIREEWFGKEHLTVANSYRNIASVYYYWAIQEEEKNHNKKARELFDLALKNMNEAQRIKFLNKLSTSHPDFKVVLNSLVNIKNRIQKLKEKTAANRVG